MLNKRGEEGGGGIGLLLTIIAGVIVVILLIVAVTGGFGNFTEKISAFFGSGTTVETIIQVCNGAASSSSKYLYCDDFKQVKFSTGIEYINCQDDRVSRNLESTLDCGDGPDSIVTNNKDYLYCKKLLGDLYSKAGKDTDAGKAQLSKSCKSTVVNGKSCELISIDLCDPLTYR